ncbi:hypothetical protein FFT09_22645 [Saccharomonospora piscinae]|nr:hypothetical protein FFT09_22645 [Saccharomonospora piscinae]
MDSEPVCARCRRPVCTDHAKLNGDNRLRVRRRHWPEGPVCVACFEQAVNTYGRCGGCGTHRLLPGRAPDGTGLCTNCAGGLGDFTCRRCGQEGPSYRAGACARCVLADRLTELLDDGSGTVRAELMPLFHLIHGMNWPNSRLTWLRRPAPARVLTALARGEVPLTHHGLSQLQPWRSAIYIRDLLVECGVLPPVDRFLLLFEQWLPTWLETIDDPGHSRLLTRFGTWHVLRRLRHGPPVTSYRLNNARHTMRTAAQFLTYLAYDGRRIDGCTQADIDHWFASKPAQTGHATREFLQWCRRQRELPPLDSPPVMHTQAAPLGQQERIAFIRRVLTDHAIPPADRVLALLILLYAQPLIRIAGLTVDDVIRDDNQVLIRLGNPPTPVPEPFASVLTDYLDHRLNLNTAANANNRHLFPGRRAGQPLHTTSLRLRLRNLGLPSLDGRTATIRHLLRQAPAPVVAEMLGYNPRTATQIAAEAGTTWQRYAAGDHSRR